MGLGVFGARWNNPSAGERALVDSYRMLGYHGPVTEQYVYTCGVQHVRRTLAWYKALCV